MRFAIKAEKVHAELFTKAKEAVDNGKDLEAEKIFCVSMWFYKYNR